jgi:hypothetical protein
MCASLTHVQSFLPMELRPTTDQRGPLGASPVLGSTWVASRTTPQHPAGFLDGPTKISISPNSLLPIVLTYRIHPIKRSPADSEQE